MPVAPADADRLTSRMRERAAENAPRRVVMTAEERQADAEQLRLEAAQAERTMRSVFGPPLARMTKVVRPRIRVRPRRRGAGRPGRRPRSRSSVRSGGGSDDGPGGPSEPAPAGALTAVVA